MQSRTVKAAVRPARVLIALLTLCCWAAGPAAPAGAAQSASLRVTLSPERLGHGTSLSLGLRIAAPAGRLSSPLTRFTLGYPSDLGFSTSGLGLTSCSPDLLEAFGPGGCPEESRMGRGSALTEIPYGPGIARERTQLVALRAPEQSGHPALVFYLIGTDPVIAQITLRSLLLPGLDPTEERMRIDVPLVAAIPGGPDAALTQLSMTIGSTGLVYHERVHGRLISYRPPGILLPDRCPRGGFRFRATLAFRDGTTAHTRSVVPCPRHRA